MQGIRLFNNLPIERKLLLVSLIPILTLGGFSFVTYYSVQTFAEDEDRLNHVYHVQTTAAEYLRLIVDLETGFRGFVLTKQPKFLQPYLAAQQRVLTVGQSLGQMVEPYQEQRQVVNQAQQLVEQLMKDKDNLIEQVKRGNTADALHYIE
ncbi:MAG: CHASE3 domain-containing protein, partial [Nitrospirae bacterium]|nr:CHASE3 domain-containing protein [Nitrospirota bacterium]